MSSVRRFGFRPGRHQRWTLGYPAACPGRSTLAPKGPPGPKLGGTRFPTLVHSPSRYPQNGECCWSHSSPSAIEHLGFTLLSVRHSSPSASLFLQSLSHAFRQCQNSPCLRIFASEPPHCGEPCRARNSLSAAISLQTSRLRGFSTVLVSYCFYMYSDPAHLRTFRKDTWGTES
jgi:hypothetical protein